MPEPILYSLTLLANSPFIFADARTPDKVPAPPNSIQEVASMPGQFSSSPVRTGIQPELGFNEPSSNGLNTERVDFSLESSPAIAPRSGGQLYAQRLAALRAGKLYTHLPRNSFREVWSQSVIQPTYEQWRRLLTLEARALSLGQGQQPLSVLVGDSLSLWFPSDRLPHNQLWLNQSISGDTTWSILQRLSLFAETQPNQIYVMAGINDLKMGASDAELLWNLQRIVQQLRATHPNTKIIVQSILPTRLSQSINARIVGINRQLASISNREGASYLDLSAKFKDDDEQLNTDYTTDGVHLSQAGYAVWQSAVKQPEVKIAKF